MTEPFIGEIQMFGFNFAPYHWASCDGALLLIQQNTALFSLLGVNYGGDGRTNFRLPNFVNRAATNQGQGPGLTPHVMGETYGSHTVALDQQSVPTHGHSLTVYNQRDSSKRNTTPEAGNYLGVPASGMPFVTAASANAQFSPRMLAGSGGGQPHENRQPYLASNFCIALQGVFPAFS